MSVSTAIYDLTGAIETEVQAYLFRAPFKETLLILEQVSRIGEYLRYRRGSRLGATRSIASLPWPK